MAAARVTLLLLLASCASSVRPAVGVGKATARVQVLVHLGVDGQKVIRRRLVTVNNPTDEDVILDCASMRVRFAAHLQQDILLMPGDKGCDLQNDVAYESIPIPDVIMQVQGRVAPR